MSEQEPPTPGGEIEQNKYIQTEKYISTKKYLVNMSNYYRNSRKEKVENEELQKKS